MRKLMSSYYLTILVLVVTIGCLAFFTKLFIEPTSPVALMVTEFAKDLL